MQHLDDIPLAVDRRQMLIAASVGLVASIVPLVQAVVSDDAKATIRDLIGSATPQQGGVALRVPETAENARRSASAGRHQPVRGQAGPVKPRNGSAASQPPFDAENI